MIKLDYLKRRFPIVKSIPTVFESCLTVEEQIYCIYNYCQDVLLPAHNTNASAIEEIQEVLDTLQPYVNNKLDEMLENGQFQEFIESEVFQDFNTRLGTVETGLDSINEELEDIQDDIVENTQNINANSLEIQKLKDCFILKGEITLPANETHENKEYILPEEFINVDNYYLEFIGFDNSGYAEENKYYWNGICGTGMEVGPLNYGHGNMTAKIIKSRNTLRIDLSRGMSVTEDSQFDFIVIYKKYPDKEPIELELYDPSA